MLSMKNITGGQMTEYELYEAFNRNPRLGTVSQLRPVNLVRMASYTEGRAAVRQFLNAPVETQQRELLDALVGQFGESASVLARKIARVPRHRIVPPGAEKLAYVNGIIYVDGLNALTPPGFTLFCAQQFNLTEGSRVGVVGFGNGYLTAAFSNIVGPKGHIVAWEIDKELVSRGKALMKSLRLTNVTLYNVDATKDVPEADDIDAFWTTIAVPRIPQVWRTKPKEGTHLGIFRPWSLQELRRRQGKDAKREKYLAGRWWEDVALAFYKKVGRRLVQGSVIGDVFNVPIAAAENPPPNEDFYARFRFYEDRLREIARG